MKSTDGRVRYAELHSISNFSFLEGASRPEELVERAVELGYAALAITDRSTLAGVVRAHGAWKSLFPEGEMRAGAMKLVIGSQVEIDGRWIVLWAMDKSGYSNLSRLLTAGFMQRGGHLAGGHPAGRDANGRDANGRDEWAAEGWHADRACRLTIDDLAAHAGGLLAGVPLAEWCHGGGAVTGRQLAPFREIFGDRLYALAEVALEGDDASRLATFGKIAREARVPVVAAGDVRYHARSRMPLFDVLAATRHGGRNSGCTGIPGCAGISSCTGIPSCTVEQIRGELLANGERHLHEPERIAERFASLPGAIERSLEVADRCTFTLDELRYEYPESVVPQGRKPAEYLAEMVWKGARKRYPEGVPGKVATLIDHELSLVEELAYEAYFLTVFDIVRFARRRGILCQGRGSAANSAICYCLGITSVDPARMDVLFERFISRERREAPDIDIDFEHERREEVLQYLYDTHGRFRAAMTAEVISYRLRSAVRDVAKALGFTLDRVGRIADALDAGDTVEQLPVRLAEAGLDPASGDCVRLVALVRELIGFPRHLGQHVGGMVMTRGELCDLVPIRPAAMEGRTIIEWNKDDLDELGILKVDCLALGMLTAIRKAFEMVEKAGGPRLSLATVPAEDPEVYEMVSRADTVGVFQIESRAQMSMLPRLRPACFYDLVIEVAIVRPGPIQGDMVHPYLRRRNGEEPVRYPSDAIRGVLEKTLGVPLFQEQAMRLAVVAAGFTPGEADQLRRAMGAWRRPGVIDEFHRRLVDGMLSRGLSREFAEAVFGQIRGFGEYGFPESHAASFALLVYVSAWLKRHHPAAFTAALLASQPMGFYAPAQLVRDARSHGVKVLPVDVNASDWNATVERVGSQEIAIRLGLEQVHGLGEAAGRRIEEARRQGGPFRLVHELARRAGIGRESLVHLARAGAVSSLGLERRRAVWEAMRCLDRPGSQPLLEGLDDDDDLDSNDLDDDIDEDRLDGEQAAPPSILPGMTRQEQVIADYRSIGLSLEAHPIHFERERLTAAGVVKVAAAMRAPEGRRVKVAGIVLTRQRPATAKGTIFLTIEDETGAANVVVRPAVWHAADHAARRAAVLVVHGRIQRRGEVVHVVAQKLETAHPEPAHPEPGATARQIPRMSRDFC